MNIFRLMTKTNIAADRQSVQNDNDAISHLNSGARLHNRIAVAAMTIIWLSHCACVRDNTGPSEPPGHRNREIVTLSAQPVEDAFDWGFSVILNIDIKNRSDRTLALLSEFSTGSAPIGGGDMWVEIEEYSGKRLGRTCTTERGNFDRTHQILVPGETLELVVDLPPQCYRFERGKKYSIVVHIRDHDWNSLAPLLGVLHVTSELISNKVSVSINP